MIVRIFFKSLLVMGLALLLSACASKPAMKSNCGCARWQISPAKGSSYMLTLKPDGLATSSLGGRGMWTQLDQETHIRWNTGSVVILRPTPDGVTMSAYAPDYGKDGSIPAAETGTATWQRP
jgi:surface antigen